MYGTLSTNLIACIQIIVFDGLVPQNEERLSPKHKKRLHGSERSHHDSCCALRKEQNQFEKGKCLLFSKLILNVNVSDSYFPCERKVNYSFAHVAKIYMYMQFISMCTDLLSTAVH